MFLVGKGYIGHAALNLHNDHQVHGQSLFTGIKVIKTRLDDALVKRLYPVNVVPSDAAR